MNCDYFQDCEASAVVVVVVAAVVVSSTSLTSFAAV